MTSTIFSNLRYFVSVIALPIVVSLTVLELGCDTTQEMVSGIGVPASQGTVSTRVEHNGNTKVTINVKHLALPSKMAPGATVYVVWIRDQNGEEQNAGALTLNDNLEGSLNTMTPYNRFRVIVTPESSGQVEKPTNAPVFTSEVDSSK